MGVLSPAQMTGFPKGAKRVDITKGIPFPDSSTSHIYSSHMLEHLSRWQAASVLRECKRVLVLNGLVRFAVPDLRHLAEMYLGAEPYDTRAGLPAADVFMKGINPRYDVQTGILKRILWRNLSGAQHQWMYDADSLCALFKEAGFESPTVTQYRESAMPDLDTLENRPESVFVEAYKT